MERLVLHIKKYIHASCRFGTARFQNLILEWKENHLLWLNWIRFTDDWIDSCFFLLPDGETASIPLSFSLLHPFLFPFDGIFWTMLLTFLASDSFVSSKPQTSLLYTLLTQNRNKKKVRFIYHENGRRRKEIKPRKEMRTQNQPTTQQEMEKRKFLDASNAKDNQSWPLFSLEFGSAFSTTDKRWKKKEPSENLRSVVRFPGAGSNSFCYWWQNNQTATNTRKKIDHKKTGAIGHSWNGTEKWPRMNRERIVSLSATYHKRVWLKGINVSTVCF